MRFKFWLFLLLFVVSVEAVGFSFNSTGDFDSGVKFNVTTSSDSYVQDAGCLWLNFSYASKDSNLVSYWRFEGNANDETGLNNGNVNGAVYNSSGFFGGCYGFDGSDDYLDMGASDSLNSINGSVSFLFWFKLNTYNGNASLNTRSTFISKGSEYWNKTIWLAYYNDSSDHFFIFEIGNGSTRDYLSYDYVPDLNRWYFLTAVYNSSSRKLLLYLDGGLVAEKTTSIGFIDTSTYQMDVGAYREIYHFLNGSMDELKIYNRSLSSAEINSLYNNDFKRTSLVSHWKFDGDSNDEQGLNNGTSSGDCSFEGGKYGEAMHFDGDADYVEVPASDSFKPLNITVAFWMKGELIDGNPNPVSEAYGSSYGWRFEWDSTLQEMKFITYMNGANRYDLSAGVLSNDTWYFVTGVVEGNIARIYLNGQRISEKDYGGPLSYVGASNLYIGARQPTSNYFNGTIDEVWIYNTSLTDAEILSFYNSSKKHHKQGSWASPSLSIDLNYKLGNLTLFYYNIDSGNYIDKIELLNASDDSVLSTCSGCLSSLNNVEFEGNFLRNDERLVAYWKLDNLNDEKGFFNFSNTGSVVFTEGEFGSSADFTGGSDFLTVSSDSALDPVNYSQAFWVKTTDSSNHVVTEKSWGHHFVFSDDSRCAYKWVAGAVGDSGNFVCASKEVNDDEWHFIVVTYNELENLSLYIDGLLDNSTVPNETVSANSVNLTIGARVDGSAAFNGKIDDFAFFNRSLSADEVKRLYESKKVFYESDFDNGFDLTKGNAFKLKIYFKGNGSSSPLIDAVAGEYERADEVIIVSAPGFNYSSVLVLFLVSFAVFYSVLFLDVY